MSDLIKFEFNEESINYFKEGRLIPLHFYNKTGQVLIHKKNNASEAEIDALIKFKDQGIFYNSEDEDKLYKNKKNRKIPAGLSDTKLLSRETTKELITDTKDIFNQLHKTSIDGLSAKKLKNNVNNVFLKFEKEPDAMTGLVNILEIMGGEEGLHYDMEIAIKRTVVAMALKTRGMAYQAGAEKKKIDEDMSNLLVACMMCDIAYIKMNMPETNEVNKKHRNYIQNHPLISYLMLAHEENIEHEVKRIILMHHRPISDDNNNNNYPKLKEIAQKLSELYLEYSKIPEKKSVSESIGMTIKTLKNRPSYDENPNIVALASEFASLTTKTAWRDAFSPVRAVKMIVNNSLYTYPYRVVREFLDNAAISLCDNKMLIIVGDFVILTASTIQGSSHMEVCKVTNIDRHQSRPDVRRIAFITPTIKKDPKLQLVGFDRDKVTMDKRHAQYHLENDNTRRIVYIVDPEYDGELHEYLTEISVNID